MTHLAFDRYAGRQQGGCSNDTRQFQEVAPVLIAALFFFCVLTALMLLRPARDALGMERGIESIRWLFIGTALATLAVNPVFGWLVARWLSKRRSPAPG